MNDDFAVRKTDAEWKAELEPLTYHVMREHGTEPPFKNEYNRHKVKGIYFCRACGAALFSCRRRAIIDHESRAIIDQA